MQIAYHIGAQCTDDGRLLKSVLKNADLLLENGIHVPAPRKYRNLLRETIQQLDGMPPGRDLRKALLDDILGQDDAPKMILSNPLFICVPKRIFENSLFYHLIDEKVGGMRALFPDDQIHYCLAMRNPATFLPAVFAEQSDYDLSQFLRDMQPENIRWSDAITRIHASDPQAKITVWCDEDTPLLWARLIREITGLAPTSRIVGGYDLLQSLLTEDGMRLFVSYMKSNPPASEAQKTRIIAGFLEKYAHDGVMEQQVDLPGWSQERVDHLTALYDEDVARIAQMQHITLITP